MPKFLTVRSVPPLTEEQIASASRRAIALGKRHRSKLDKKLLLGNRWKAIL